MKIADKKTLIENLLHKVIIDDSIPDLSQHPVVLKKTEKARAFFEKHPLPEHLLRK
ncbi:hypothetical protein [Dyadobacter flavalbus]|uniref:hypothetical protein n=1 Tax=Dyadobacter flavalbus TaxID=2579942 RepID=UPI0013755404|nr:hypothetical protein [Dyadobacter flavalbus]